MIRSACPCDECQEIIPGDYENVTKAGTPAPSSQGKGSLLPLLNLDGLSIMLVACAIAFIGSNVDVNGFFFSSV